LAAVVADQLELRLAARTVVAYETELRRIEAEKRNQNERFADALQATLLPARLALIPGIDLAALSRPANRSLVGGDFYDIFTSEVAPGESPSVMCAARGSMPP
jgi:sigma-B regulation protein RsbU (phosphoserine phosphatase)